MIPTQEILNLAVRQNIDEHQCEFERGLERGVGSNAEKAPVVSQEKVGPNRKFPSIRFFPGNG
jgi:hypothetical protein